MNSELDVFSNISINLHHKASLNYAKSRFAIESFAAEISKSNQARARRLSEKYKKAVIDIFQGQVEMSKQGLQVVFHDGSKAKY